MPTFNKSLTTEQYRALLTGVAKACPTTVFTIGGQTYTASALEMLITSILAAADAVAVSKASWLEAIQTITRLEAEDGGIVKDARRIMAVMFKKDPVTLSELGMDAPKTRAPLSAEARLTATEKLKATRKARGTMSKKQKLLIKGNVTGVVIAPVTLAAAVPQAANLEREGEVDAGAREA